jgi:hypothetical protein
MKATVKIIEWSMIVVLPVAVWIGFAIMFSQKINPIINNIFK